MQDLIPLFERVSNGYSEDWDGRNTIGILTEDAKTAEEEIESTIAALEDLDLCCVQDYDAADWLADDGTMIDQAAHLGITAETSDEELAAIAQECRSAAGQYVVIEHLEEYLEELRELVTS